MAFSLFKLKNRGEKKTDSVPTAPLMRERSSNPQVSIKLAEHFLRENKRDLAVDEYLNAAQAFLDKRQTQLAMAVYRNIITVDPERYGVYETLADLYRMSGFPGDGASVLLALAYQYKTAGRDSEVKRVLDAVLEFAPDNPVLKRKVQAFFAADGKPGTPAAKPPVEAKVVASVPKPPEAAPETADKPGTPAAKPPVEAKVVASAPKPPEAAPETADKPVTPAAKPPVEAKVVPPVSGPEVFPPKPSGAGSGAQVLKPEAPGFDTAVEKTFPPAQRPSSEDMSGPSAVPPSTTPAAAEGSFFDLRSALAGDEQGDGDQQPDEPRQPAEDQQSDEVQQPVEDQQPDADATARSFFDLQSALAGDASLRFDHEPVDDGLLAGGQESSLFSVLSVVKDIARQDPKQDTPQFHFSLGVAYMKCADYEQAVDELLSALYGIADKVGCYARLAECSLKLQRRELACGFLREALDCPDIGPEQIRAVKKRLDEIHRS